MLKYKLVNPAIDDNWAICHSSEEGYSEIVEVLLKDKRVEPSAYDNWSIGSAAQNGHLKVIKLLLSNPKVNLLIVKTMLLKRL